MAVFRNSRFARTTISEWEHVRIGKKLSLDPYELGPLSIEDFTPYTVKDEETFEIIAARAYGDSTKWWVIAQANREKENLFFPLDLKAGDKINVPTPYAANRV